MCGQGSKFIVTITVFLSPFEIKYVTIYQVILLLLRSPSRFYFSFMFKLLFVPYVFFWWEVDMFVCTVNWEHMNAFEKLSYLYCKCR